MRNTLPMHITFVRHGQSEANTLIERDKSGDTSWFIPDILSISDGQWRLTETGIKQAQVAGEFLAGTKFDRFIVSPYTRTRETAGHLNLENARWEENRGVRERFFGEIAVMPRSSYSEMYQLNSILRKTDPLYWAPPGGESLDEVAQNRVANLIEKLKRDDSDSVVIVTHGDFIMASRLLLESWSDEDFHERDNDRAYKIHNASVLEYTRQNPENPEDIRERLSWVRHSYPVTVSQSYPQKNERMAMVVGDWKHFERPLLSNEELLSKVDTVPHLADL